MPAALARSIRLAAAALVAVAGSAANVGAQKGVRVFIHVTARDSAGTPVPTAELTIGTGLHDVIARGKTDDAGQATLSVEVRDSLEFQVTMRKIGYPRGDRFFSIAPHDTTEVAIVIPPPRSMGPVVVTAEASVQWKSYHLDADDIERATIPLDDAWEVVKRLRPDMLTSRGGCATGAQEVWVNGKRIRLPLRPTGMTAERALIGVPPRARFSYVPVSVLSDIAPEHIKEIFYHDCFDHSMAAVGNNNAIFVILKPGVDYKQDVGSFVLDVQTAAPTKP